MCRIVFICVLLAPFLVPSLSAQSTLNFPRLSFETFGLSGIAIVNPNAVQAPVTVTAYGVDGQLIVAKGFTNPVQLVVPAGAQFAALLSSANLFGSRLDPSFIGWFEATSNVDGLTGFFLVLDSSVSFLDGADLPVASSRLFFNQIQVGDGVSTELNLINASGVAARLLLRLYSQGALVTSIDQTVVPKGVLRADAQTLFGVPVLSEDSFIEVSSNTRVAGFQLVRFEDGDLLGLNARAAQDQIQTLYFPQLVVRGIWKTEIGIVNYSDEPVILTLYVHQENGDLFGAGDLSENPVTRTLNPQESLREDIEEMFGFTEDFKEGWVEVRSTSRSINGYISYGIPGTGSIATVAAESQARKRALFAHLATSSGLFTGIALLNPGALIANVRIMALLPDGTSLGIHETTLRPGERSSRLVTQMIPDSADQSRGFIWALSDLPIYMTSLFGDNQLSVLANIPPQPSPEAFRPDAGETTLTIDPSHYLLAAGESKQFAVDGNTEAVDWGVNGQSGGSAQTGLIDGTGLYSAPALVPLALPVVITAETDNRLAGASIDILRASELIKGLGILQSVAYLNGLQRVYVAELALLSGSSSPTTTGSESDLFEVAPDLKTPIANFPGEEVSDMIAFEPQGQTSTLLVALKNTGRIVRLDPETKIAVEIASGLDQPTALVLDPATGNLLVAEQDQISSIDDSQFLSPATSTQRHPGGRDSTRTQTVPTQGTSGLAIDDCSGNLFFANQALGTIFRFVRGTSDIQEIATGLDGPTQLLGLQRSGVPCLDSFHLFVVEQDRVTLIIPATGETLPVLEAPGIADVTFIPDENPLSASGGVLTAETIGNQGQIRQAELPGLYEAQNLNPPTIPACFGTATFVDPSLDMGVRRQLGISPDQPITCLEAQAALFLGVQSSGILDLQGISALTNLQGLGASNNLINDLGPLASLKQLNFLQVNSNAISDLSPLANLKQLSDLSLYGNEIGDISPLAGLTQLIELELFSNSISNITPLTSLTQLRVLGLGFNSISDISSLAGLTQLIELDIRFNSIGDISPLADLTRLETLELDHNSINNISSLAGLTQLTELDLRSNSISEISPLRHLERLTFLDLEFNSVSDISPLVENSGIGSGDAVNLNFNPLDEDDCSDLQELISRGAIVSHSVGCP